MKHDFLFHILFPVIFALMGGFFLGIALFGFAKKRGFFLSSRWMFALICVAFTPQIIQPLIWSSDSRIHPPLVLLLSPLMFAVLLVFFWLQMRGFTGFGLGEDALRSGLAEVLQQRGLKFKESMGGYDIESPSVKLQVSFQAAMGTATIRTKSMSPDDRKFLAQVVGSLNEYLSKDSRPANLQIFIFYLIISLFILGIGAFFVFR
jgi:hypothetical protein